MNFEDNDCENYAFAKAKQTSKLFLILVLFLILRCIFAPSQGVLLEIKAEIIPEEPGQVMLPRDFEETKVASSDNVTLSLSKWCRKKTASRYR